VLLVFGGVWLGHMLEHFRVEGPAGLVHELRHSVHLYMVPLGVLFLVLATLAAVAWARLEALLTARAERASARLRRAWRGAPAPRPADLAPATPATSTTAPRWRSVALSLAVAQLVLYGVQEHIEHSLAGHRDSVLEIFGGAHWGASLIQVAVAFVLAAIVVRCRRRVVHLSRRIDAVERLAHWLTRTRNVVRAMAPARRVRSFTPLERFGRHLLQRPPPALRISH
jgi:hypothetical protein